MVTLMIERAGKEYGVKPLGNILLQTRKSISI
ncbi:hypothetical protein JOC94_002041 [Bacillus thermophilus]|uniref:Uncharacterized protein n=1 Tax=Siminovitchia thermophila TaxID=1245522 RepID=A0ABS2R7D5_9BACI|nr:hypothetical protein [Siminovitchia thermophila]